MRTGPRPARTRRQRALALAAVLALAASCSSAGGEGGAVASPTTSTVADATSTTAAPVGPHGFPEGVEVVDADDDLYALAEDPGDGEPGEPVAVQPVATELEGDLWRVLYRSTSVAGDPVVVSGLIAVPAGEPPSGGRRPVAAWAHGTTGVADECAPSRTLAQIEAAIPLLERGMVVTATDYEGLGTPGLHPYLVGESQGRSVLDLVRAAQALGPRVGAGEPVVLWGHSQGGHAVLFANEIAPTWAPELDVVATVAGAPPSQMPLLLGALGSGPTSFFLGMVIAGWAAAYPDADPADLLTPTGLERLALVEEGCIGELAAAWGAPAPEPLVRDVAADPPAPWGELFQANEPGQAAGAGPVLILHGEDDALVPAVTSAILAERMCGVGQEVQRRSYPGADHLSVIPASLDDLLNWIEERLAGVPVEAGCAEPGN